MAQHDEGHAPGSRCQEGHIFERRALKRSFVQRRHVELDTNKGLPVQAQATQVAVFEVHTVEGTSFEDRFSQVVFARC